jgi:hypothetical protein
MYMECLKLVFEKLIGKQLATTAFSYNFSSSEESCGEVSTSSSESTPSAFFMPPRSHSFVARRGVDGSETKRTRILMLRSSQQNTIGTMMWFRLTALLSTLAVASAERFNEIKVSVKSGARKASCRSVCTLTFDVCTGREFCVRDAGPWCHARVMTLVCSYPMI